ncbi:MAG: HD-GYP domain-containing protein [Deltaproteobacteria bacterium]|nr:HD-GYP domain-containing protein [Deltaproteobacteria bacterium]MBW2015651.1 HD-GYP domain-containing protein [Deltaproteobacteria bacterium]MBW2128358.1 HD-GYP domain-containing protein [Deltaproteobacteria bacterium]MBW2302512.1 HD-GYP domain-containing protein [Deltaproteobacteria bacterium]
MLSEREKIDLINQISLDFNQTKDIDLLLEKILANVRKLLDADAGSIYLKRGDSLTFSHTQNDTLRKRLKPNEKLVFNTHSVPINNASIAGFVAKNKQALNIPDVYRLNSSVPYIFDSHFDRLTDYRTRSVLAVPMTNQRGEVLGVMQIINALDENGRPIPFSPTDEALCMHFATSAALAVERAQMTRNIILRMISMASLRDPRETAGHVNRVAAYSVEIYERWATAQGITPEEIERQKDVLRLAAMLHDVGKIAISDLILKKPDRLSVDEFEIMKSHTYLGARLFHDVQSDFEEMAATVALNHHEKWDGTGYPGHIDPVSGHPVPGRILPDGRPEPKRGEEIPLFGRIVAVADVYDALCSHRSYKEAWNEDRVLEEMHQSSGKHFDPEILEAFFSCLEILKSISSRYPDENNEKESMPQCLP